MAPSPKQHVTSSAVSTPARSYLNGPNLHDSPQPLVLPHGPTPSTPHHPPYRLTLPSGLTFSSLTLGKISTSPVTSASTTSHPLLSYTLPTMIIPPQQPPALIPDLINILLSNGLITSSIVALSTASLATTSRPYYDTTADNIPPSRRTTSKQNLFFDGLELGDVPHAPRLNNLPPWNSRRHVTSFKDIAIRKSPPP